MRQMNKLLTSFSYNQVIVNVGCSLYSIFDHLDANSGSKSSIYTEFCNMWFYKLELSYVILPTNFNTK